MSKARRSTDIVVYLRCRLADRVASDAAMIEQRVMLATWCAAQAEAQSILAEFLEEEGEGVSRPSLVAAIAFCKARKATLVIVSMQPIGTGQPFEPRIASVPVAILPQPKRPTPSVIPLPAKSRDEVSLYVGTVENGRVPVYLCNPKSVALTDVTVTIDGFYTAVRHDESLILMSGASKIFARIEPGTAQLIETRDINKEGESIDRTQIRFDQGGKIRESIAFLNKQFDPVFIALKFVAAPTPVTAPSSKDPPS